MNDSYPTLLPVVCDHGHVLTPSFARLTCQRRVWNANYKYDVDCDRPVVFISNFPAVLAALRLGSMTDQELFKMLCDLDAWRGLKGRRGA